MNSPRLLVIEDDAFTRTSIVGALTGNGIEVIDSVGTSAEAITHLKSTPLMQFSLI
jgi:CheY-like chemotaxis protein